MRISTLELQEPGVTERLLEEGFRYIRRYDDRRFERIVRNPTIGCIVELFFLEHVRCVPLDSAKARALIRRKCYF
jgi:hypothetical protein